MSPYDLPLKVARTDGKRIVAKIKQLDAKRNVIQLPMLGEVKKDKPPFAVKGVIVMTYLRVSHTEVVTKITKYLEDLFLKEMEDVSNDSKHPGKTDARGSKEVVDTGTASEGKRSESGSVHDSGGRNKSADGAGRGKPKATVAKDSNTKDSSDT